MTWSTEAYFNKAQKYWIRATEKEREADDFLLNVAFFCEFVIRGALVHVNPLLNAASDEESLLFAAGASPNKPPRTVDVSAALSRLSRFIPNLSEEEKAALEAIVSLRNIELHGDTEHRSEGKETAIPLIYAFCEKVSNFVQRDLSTILGKEDAEHARRTAKAVAEDRTKRVRDLIRIQKDRFFGLPEQEQEERRKSGSPSFISAVMRSGHHLKAEQCPSCASNGMLGGAPIGRSAPILRDDGIYEEIRIAPDIFSCKTCGLEIKGLDELMAAGFGHEFHTLDERDVIEHFEINPIDYVDTDEIVREHQAEYEYRDE